MEEEARIDEAVTQLLTSAQRRFRYEHARLIGTAAYYAAKAHKGQERKSGGPYVLHPIRVAQLLVDLDDSHIDVTTICAALLHDVLEDTDLAASQIDKQFGRDVTSLVQALTKKPSKKAKEKQDKEYFEQLKRYEKSDPRVALIKVADVYDNAQTINVHSKKNRVRRANNLLEFYVPLAKRLELQDIAKELEAIAHEALE